MHTSNIGGEAFVKDLLKRGRYSFTLREAGETLGKQGPGLNLALQRLKKAGWIAPVSRGFYVALDVQHQAAGMLDPIWFVDDWARHMRMAYYVGGLSAAERHGAAHQRPMQFQVFGDRQVRGVTQPKLHLATFYKRELDPNARTMVATFQRYMAAEGKQVTRAEFRANLAAKLDHPGFIKDCAPLLKSGAVFDPPSDAKLLEERILSLLPNPKASAAQRIPAEGRLLP